MRPKYPLLLFALLGLGLANCGGNDSPSEPAPSATSEAHRPLFHFTPDSMWMNDPNGMVYYEGEYHLFYQYYPDSTVWGPMHWGHAVSEDLVHWERLPVALYPDSLGYIFSGSAVIDWGNSSGLGENGRPPMVAIFTHHDPEGDKAGRDDFQYQSIAYSLDKGRTWTKYAGNPVLPNPGIRDFRDPKVFWHKASEKWVMALAVDDHIRFYSSPNLLSWQYESEFGKGIGGQGGVWECPDLFALPLEGRAEPMWVLLVSINPGAPNGGSGTQYFLGDFDGRRFQMAPDFAKKVAEDTLSGNPYWIDYGRDNYAGVTWSDIPETDGRRLFIGWMSNWDYAQSVPTERWRSAMTIARRLSLATTPEGTVLASEPVQELQQLRSDTVRIPGTPVSGALPITQWAAKSSPLLELDVNLSWTADKAPKAITLVFSNEAGEEFRTGLDLQGGQYFTDRSRAGDTGFEAGFAGRHTAPRWRNGQTARLHLFLDVASAELFADDGLSVMTDIFFPKQPFRQVRLEVEGGEVELSGTLYHLTP